MQLPKHFTKKQEHFPGFLSAPRLAEATGGMVAD